MTTGYIPKLFVIWRRYRGAMLAFCLVFGLQVGALGFGDSDLSFPDFLQATEFGVWGLLMVALLPVGLCAILVKCRADFLLPAVLFWKGCAFAAVSVMIGRSYGSAWWLVQALVLGIRQIQLLILTVFCFHYSEKTDTPSFLAMAPYFILNLILFLLEYFFVARFCANIL